AGAPVPARGGSATGTGGARPPGNPSPASGGTRAAGRPAEPNGLGPASEPTPAPAAAKPRPRPKRAATATGPTQAAPPQPAAWSGVASVGVPAASAVEPLFRTPCDGGISPVMIEVCAGSVIGACACAEVKRTPVAAMRSMAGVSGPFE